MLPDGTDKAWRFQNTKRPKAVTLSRGSWNRIYNPEIVRSVMAPIACSEIRTIWPALQAAISKDSVRAALSKGEITMAKSRSFSIYLLKKGQSEANSLKDDHALGQAVLSASGLPENATLYIQDKSPAPPWWKDYWGIEQDLKQTLKGAIVFLPIKKRCFAITFGHTYHNLKEDCYEYDFGLRTSLNVLDPKKLKSTDILQPESAKRERIQLPVAADLTYFDFNTDESIVKKLTGSVKTEYKDILTNITGASSLKISSKVTAEEIVGLCEKLLNIYGKDDFKQSFPNIQNIVPVKDPTITKVLNNSLLEAFKADSIELVLTIPEIIEHGDSFRIKYSGAGRDESIYEDVYIANYREYLDNRKIKQVDLANLISHKLNIVDDNNNTLKSYSVFKCLLFEHHTTSKHYHLCEGEWYEVNEDYIKKLKASLDPSFSKLDVLVDCNHKREDDYCTSIGAGKNSVVCLDKSNISPKGQYQVEPCDLYCVEVGTATLIHIKISTRSSPLSHLFNQGLNSVELLRSVPESKNKLKKLLNDKVALCDPIDSDDFEVIYGIITGKNPSKRSDNLPIFSRISLLRTINTLKLMGIRHRVVLIKDLVDRKKKKK
ncbi:MAG: TIGR04141 family sporadically distributed protein [Planctomycetes bacterium]|nr:TIGR04141 family sporadically distributed protein [Planctomycetota bacterium]